MRKPVAYHRLGVKEETARGRRLQPGSARWRAWWSRKPPYPKGQAPVYASRDGRSRIWGVGMPFLDRGDLYQTKDDLPRAARALSGPDFGRVVTNRNQLGQWHPATQVVVIRFLISGYRMGQPNGLSWVQGGFAYPFRQVERFRQMSQEQLLSWIKTNCMLDPLQQATNIDGPFSAVIVSYAAA